MTMRKHLVLGLSVASIAAAGTAFAAQDQIKEKLRVDRVLTRAEAQQRAEANFARLDVNKDGKIDQADRAAMRLTMKTQRFARLDTDSNGQISKAEFMAPRATRQGGEPDGSTAKPHGRSGHGKAGYGHGRHHGMRGHGFAADLDRNGAIAPAEFTSAALQRFDAMDANKDGQVTTAERRDHRARMRTQRRQQPAASPQS